MIAADVHLALLDILNWIDDYFYDAIPKTELRRCMEPLIEKADEADGGCCR